MKIKDLVRPDFPSTESAFWDGFASIFDFHGRSRGGNSLDTDGDAKAIERDWQVVGNDMRRVIERFKHP